MQQQVLETAASHLEPAGPNESRMKRIHTTTATKNPNTGGQSPRLPWTYRRPHHPQSQKNPPNFQSWKTPNRRGRLWGGRHPWCTQLPTFRPNYLWLGLNPKDGQVKKASQGSLNTCKYPWQRPQLTFALGPDDSMADRTLVPDSECGIMETGFKRWETIDCHLLNSGSRCDPRLSPNICSSGRHIVHSIMWTCLSPSHTDASQWLDWRKETTQ